MYTTANGLVNGDVINDLLKLCNNWFVNPWVKPYAGANDECMFCGCYRNENHHSAADCPVIRLRDIAEKYPKYIKENKNG